MNKHYYYYYYYYYYLLDGGMVATPFEPPGSFVGKRNNKT